MVFQYFIIWTIFSLISDAHSKCDLTPTGIVRPRSKVGANRYIIDIPGNPQSYIPLQKYNLFLKRNPDLPSRTFRHFILTVEPEDSENDDAPAVAVGQLQLHNGTETLIRFTTVCPNTVIDSSSVSKTEIQVNWIAPPKDSGCIVIKATVVESREDWYSEDGKLTRVLCEDKRDDPDVQPETLRHCCACQEARYEVAIEGKWTRNTHPKHFPSDMWNTGFSDVVGASHQLNHAFWEYDDYASDGLKELADTGVTQTLETELKNNRQYIRTTIKALGLRYPNITNTTYAIVSVDSKNHLVSLVSKITPSPDWIVGVSNLELCTPDCTWKESIILNLYPWDVGINDGIGYTSSQPTLEKHPIRRITESDPNHPSSPFYSEQGEKIKPMAKLHLTRQRLYNTTCPTIHSDKPTNCATTDWSEWSACSERCGDGITFRQREFLNESEADKCDVELLEIRNCSGRSKQCHITKPDTETAPEPETTLAPKSTTETVPVIEDPNCPGTFWGEWSECSVNCGKGNKTRIRMVDFNTKLTDEEGRNCFGSETVECEGPCDKSQTDTDRSRINCKVSNWSQWSRCILDDKEAICGEGYKYKDRQILTYPQNGGYACPVELEKKKNCSISCRTLELLTECVMGRWSHWTPCSSNCGEFAVQIRTRNILYQPPGVECTEDREERKPCHLPLACDENGQPIY